VTNTPAGLRLVDNGQAVIDQIRPMPHNIQAEQCVLGAVMLAPQVLAEVRELLDGSEFYRPAHQAIWDAVTALADRGAPYDPITVGAELGRGLAKTGGAPYLHTLISSVPAAAQATYYAHMLRDLAFARRVVETGTRLAQLGYASGEDTMNADLRAVVMAECSGLATADTRGWPDPMPLSGSPKLPIFPVWVLPGWLGEYTAGLAEITQTPPDLAGCLALAVLAVAAGGNVWVKAPAWREPTNLFTVVVLPPGNRKSEVYSSMTAPIKAAEKTLAENAKPRIAEALIAHRVAEAHAEKSAKAAADATDPTVQANKLEEATIAALTLEASQIQPVPRLYSDDATVEVLTSLLCEQGGKFSVLSPEGEIFSIAAGRYSGAPNFAVLKSGHAGEEMRIDRMSRSSERIDAATVTLGICTQPGVLTRLGDTPQFRDQGLLGRVLYSLPESLLGYRKEKPEPIPENVAQDYAANIAALVLALHGRAEPATLHFTLEGEAGVIRLLAETEPRFRPGADLAHMTDWGGKLVGAIVRIAGLLHLAKHHQDGWERPIEAETLESAAEIGEYFTVHAQAAYDAIGADPSVSDARALLEWARNTGTQRFKTSEILASLRHRFKKVSDIEPALRVLESHGWLRRIPAPPSTGRGRPSAPTYEFHPEATE
jgi:replicative DNA helicase